MCFILSPIKHQQKGCFGKWLWVMYNTYIGDLWLTQTKTSSSPVKHINLTSNSIKVWSEENSKTLNKKKKKRAGCPFQHGRSVWADSCRKDGCRWEGYEAWVLRLKESVLVLFTELKESCLFLSAPTRRPTILMLHFSTVYSLGFISLMFSLSSPQ